jgi:preprotein translocase subunit SecG
MTTVFLIIHVLLALALIGVVLLQRSEGGGLGIGGGGGMSGLMTGRSSANLLTRVTAGLAALFFATSLVLALLASTPSRAPSPLDDLDSAPASAPASTAPAAPAPAAQPAAPATETGGAPQAPAVPQGQ